MYNSYFIQALQDEFYRVFHFDPTSPLFFSASQQSLLSNFAFAYLMGPQHQKLGTEP